MNQSLLPIRQICITCGFLRFDAVSNGRDYQAKPVCSNPALLPAPDAPQPAAVLAYETCRGEHWADNEDE